MIPGKDQQSGLSPYFHWGHLFPGEAARAVLEAGGEKNPAVQSFLEELLVRRELGFNYCLHTPGAPAALRGLPAPLGARVAGHAPQGPARAPLHPGGAGRGAHRGRAVERLPARAARARPHPQLPAHAVGQEAPGVEPHARRRRSSAWRTSTIATPWTGRDPASVANFMWVLGLHDRPFQERKVLGKVRPMSSLRTAEKFDLGALPGTVGPAGRRAGEAASPPGCRK